LFAQLNPLPGTDGILVPSLQNHVIATNGPLGEAFICFIQSRYWAVSGFGPAGSVAFAGTGSASNETSEIMHAEAVLKHIITVRIWVFAGPVACLLPSVAVKRSRRHLKTVTKAKDSASRMRTWMNVWNG